MKIKFIVKPPLRKEFEKEFWKLKKGFKAEKELTEKEGPRSAKNLARKAIQEGFDRIVLMGGDGLLNEGLNGIMDATYGRIPSNFAIGIIPAGSGNNFAKALNIPSSIQEAFQTIKNNRTTLVDIGKVNQKFFINVVSFGFDAKINKLANKIKTKYHFLPKEGLYLLPALKEIITKIPLYEIEIRAKAINLRQKVILLAVNNGPSYGAIFKIAPAAAINDGKVDICLIKSVGKIRAFFDIYRLIKGTHIYLPEVKILKLSSLTVSSPEPLPYLIDGEVPEPKKTYEINVLPRAIRVLTP